MNRTGIINMTRRSTIGLPNINGSNLYETAKTGSGLVNTSRSEAKKVQYALEMMKREGNKGNKLSEPTIDISELIDLDKLLFLMTGSSEYIDLNRLEEVDKNFLISLFKSLKKPISGLSNTTVTLQQLFVRHVLTCCKKFDKIQILRGIAMMNNFTFAVTLTDEAEL